MPDSDRTLEILIRLKAEIDEALKAKGALEGVKSSADEITTSLPEGSAAWAKYIHSVRESSATNAEGSGNQKG